MPGDERDHREKPEGGGTRKVSPPFRWFEVQPRPVIGLPGLHGRSRTRISLRHGTLGPSICRVRRQEAPASP